MKVTSLKTTKLKLGANQIKNFGDYSEIILLGWKGIQRASVKVDSEDVPLLSQHRWTASYKGKRFYVVTYKEGRFLLMHRLLMSASKGDIVDHINHDTLDNRKKNLRIVTQRQNLNNLEKIGVEKTRQGKWMVRLRVGTVRKSFGTFASKEMAVLEKKEKIKELLGIEIK